MLMKMVKANSRKCIRSALSVIKLNSKTRIACFHHWIGSSDLPSISRSFALSFYSDLER